MTVHYDLYVRVSQTNNWASLRQYALIARQLNITGLGIDTSFKNDSLKKELRTVHDSSVNFISRLTITANKIPQIKHMLDKNRHRTQIIAVKSNDLSICKWAAHDRRVDLITIDPSHITIDKGLSNLLKKNEKPIELVYAPLLRVYGTRRSQLFRNYYKILTWVLRKRIPLVISSGGTSIFDLRGYRETMAIASQLGLSMSIAHIAISKIPLQIINSRQNRLNLNI